MQVKKRRLTLISRGNNPVSASAQITNWDLITLNKMEKYFYWDEREDRQVKYDTEQIHYLLVIESGYGEIDDHFRYSPSLFNSQPPA